MEIPSLIQCYHFIPYFHRTLQSQLGLLPLMVKNIGRIPNYCVRKDALVNNMQLFSNFHFI